MRSSFSLQGGQAQAALQSIFDALHSRHRQMLFTTDVHPWEMQGFGDSLKSRLGSGLRCAIDLPDIEMRRTMVYQEARNLGLEIDPQAADSIARLVRSNARAVKVAVRRLFAYSRFTRSRFHLVSSRRRYPRVSYDSESIVGGKSIKYEVVVSVTNARRSRPDGDSENCRCSKARTGRGCCTSMRLVSTNWLLGCSDSTRS
ncbi:MAG: DnaA ATPase domain-containing protein [Burkholderiales bacterium]